MDAPPLEWRANLEGAIGPDSASTPARAPEGASPDVAARACAAWFRVLARAMKTARLYRSDNALVQQARAKAVDELLAQVRDRGGWRLSFTPTEILLGGEPVVAPKPGRASENVFASAEQALPFLFHRDGVRSLSISPELPRREAESLFDALAHGCAEKRAAEDLVTLLWQANLEYVEVESVPLDQAIVLAESDQGDDPRGAGASGAASGASGQARSEAGGGPGVRDKHRDPFDDWAMPDPTTIDVAQAFARLEAEVGPSLARVGAIWREQLGGDWDRHVPAVVRAILALDDSKDVRAALARSAATWLASTLDLHFLDRTLRAIEVLHEIDPDLSLCHEVMVRALDQVDAAELAGYLDEADAHEHGRFAGLMVRLDAVATPLTFQVMRHATRSRTRAAAATALCYQCAEEPQRLAAYINDPQADVVLNLVFVLGQIGGPGVMDSLRIAAQHTDPRVRRQAVLSMGSAPEKERVPALLDELARLDPHILGATLSMLARRQDEQVWRFIAGLIENPDFEQRSEDVQRALFNALTEVAEDSAVPALDRVLNRGGFMKRRTFTQLAAAQALRRLGTPAARRVLEAGLTSKHAAVRSACGDALHLKAA